jgi:hypothetical protein
LIFSGSGLTIRARGRGTMTIAGADAGQAARGPHITDFGHANRDETDVIMTKIREM